MKKTLSLILALLMCLSLCACGASEEAPVSTDTSDASISKDTGISEAASEDQAENIPDKSQDETAELDIDTFPFVGTWTNDSHQAYLRIKEDGSILCESILKSSFTSTTNGVTTSNSSKSVYTSNYTWSLENDIFLFNGSSRFTPIIKDDQFCLVGDNVTYYRVGELDYVISLETETEQPTDLRPLASEYSIGTPIIADGIELTLTEAGVSDDIRISSKSSGIKITAGPSVEEGKQYVYLKGTLKNTQTTASRAVIGGTIYLDEYQFALEIDTIETSGNYTSLVDPLETVNILLYAQISDEMASIFSSGSVVFGFNDNFADVQVETAKYLYSVDIAR